MRLYIAGPMSGCVEHNFPAFKQVYEIWSACGHDMVDPRLLNSLEDQKSWEGCMRVDIAHLVTCEGIVYLPGWKQSRGASLEMHIAKALSMPDFDCRIPFVQPSNQLGKNSAYKLTLEYVNMLDVATHLPSTWLTWYLEQSSEFREALDKVRKFLGVDECQMMAK